MTTAHDIDWPQLLAERLTTTSPDVLRELLSMFIHTLMGAEADVLCGAGYGQRSAERTNQRNGYRHRQFDTSSSSNQSFVKSLASEIARPISRYAANHSLCFVLWVTLRQDVPVVFADQHSPRCGARPIPAAHDGV